MNTTLKQLMIEGFGGDGSIRFYTEKVKDGLWIGEKHFIEKYFTKLGKVLDIGCGTGRTTIPLAEMEYDVLGIDIAPNMIESAQRILQEREILDKGNERSAKSFSITYEVADATALKLPSDTYNYALFSNQGWSQIPERAERQKALQEISRVLKKNGIMIFTVHHLHFWHEPLYWTEQWVRFYIMKPLGFRIDEVEFGDCVFGKEPRDNQRTYANNQFIHFMTPREVRTEIQKSGLTLLEVNGEYQISDKDVRKHPPVFYICQNQT